MYELIFLCVVQNKQLPYYRFVQHSESGDLSRFCYGKVHTYLFTKGIFTMKKLLCSILAIVCVFALFSCGDKEVDLSAFTSAISNSKPTGVTSDANYGDYKQTYTYIAGTHKSDGKAAATFTSVIGRKANVEDQSDSSDYTETTVKYYYDGKVKTGDGEWAEGTLFSGITLNLSNENLKSGSIVIDGNTLTAVVPADKVNAVLGLENGSTGDVNLKVVTDGVYLTSVELSWQVNGVSSAVKTVYTYDNHVLDFAK